MQDRPTARELLATIGDLLQGEILAATSGPLKHQVGVAGNLCRILERELELQHDNDELAVGRLAEVLGLHASEHSLDALTRELATRLRSGTAVDGERDEGSDGKTDKESDLEQRAWSALVEIVRGKLAVNKPGHDSYDFSAEIHRETDR
jgi:hypothetical protein